MTTYTLQQVRTVQRFPVYYGWVIWGLGTFGLIAASPAMGFTISLFYDHFIEDFGLSRTMVSTLLGLGTFFGALSLTWIGRQVDKNGSRRVGTVITIAYALILIGLSVFITGPLTLFFAFYALRSMGQGGMLLISNTAISKWWENRRGWVMSLTFVTLALSQTYYLQLVQSLIDAHGWRMTWMILGVMVGVTIVPLWYFLMRDRPEDFDLEPDGGHTLDETGESSEPNHEHFSWTLKEARGTAIFWAFLSGRVFSVMLGSGLMIHQVSIFAEVGHSVAVVANVFGLIAIARAGFTLFFGRIIGRLKPAHVISLQLMSLVVVLIMAMTMREQWMLYVFGITFGLVIALAGLFDGTVWADLFGRRYHGEIRGFVITVTVIGTSIGPVIYGLSYDVLGGYTPVLSAGALVLIIPTIISLLVKCPTRVPAEALALDTA